MATGGVHIVIDRVALTRLLRSPFGPVGRDAMKRGRRVRERAQRLAPKRTGRLAASIDVKMKIRPLGIVVEVGTGLSYARYQHDGTGIHGPRHRPIKARPGHVMVFGGSGGRTVFTRSVAGTPATKFLERALLAAV